MAPTLLDSTADPVALEADRIIHLPAGMMGLPEATRFELVASAENPPLLWLRSLGAEPINFPVVEPGPLVPDYPVEIPDADAATLDIAADAEPLVLNVLTVRSLSPQKATLNLVAPIVINRATLVGKQVVIENYERYSVEYPVIDETPETPGAAAC